MAFYHTVPTYVSNFGQVTKIGDPVSTLSPSHPYTLKMQSIYQPDANPRGLGPAPPFVTHSPLFSLHSLMKPPDRIISGLYLEIPQNSSTPQSFPQKNSVRPSVRTWHQNTNGKTQQRQVPDGFTAFGSSVPRMTRVQTENLFPHVPRILRNLAEITKFGDAGRIVYGFKKTSNSSTRFMQGKNDDVWSRGKASRRMASISIPSKPLRSNPSPQVQTPPQFPSTSITIFQNSQRSPLCFAQTKRPSINANGSSQISSIPGSPPNSLYS